MDDEYVRRQYLREEDFLETHFGLADLVAPRLGWQPKYQCNDISRRRRDFHLAKNRLTELTFDAAVLFHGREGLSSIRLYLRSSARFLVARISWVVAETVVEVLADVLRSRAT